MFKLSAFSALMLACGVAAAATSGGVGAAGVGVGGHGASGIAGHTPLDPKTGKPVDIRDGGYVVKAGQCVNLYNANPVEMKLCEQSQSRRTK
jgi:hypothetical protein